MVIMGTGIVSCSPEGKMEQPPNILFIMTDDHTRQALHAYGHGLLDTVLFPNMDRLAKEGAIFMQSFVTNSISAPSRAVMLTGKHSHLNGQIDNSRGRFDWNQQTYPKLLQEAGYQTALVGKIHIDGVPQGFDYSMTLPGQGRYYNPDFIRNGDERIQFEGHSTQLITQFVIDWLEYDRDCNKPFAMLFQTKAPHRNWMAETKYLNFLEDHDFELPPNFFDDYSGRGAAAREQEMEILNHTYWGLDLKFEENPLTGERDIRYDRNIDRMTDEQRIAWRNVYDPLNEAFLENVPESKYEIIFQSIPRDISHDFLQKTTEGLQIARFMYNRYLRDYLKTVKSVDDGIGRVIEYLEKNDLLENTVIIYTSDQGFYLGEHGWYDKRFMYEQSLSTPLLVRYPSEIEAGTKVFDLVQNLDLAPTMLDYAGVEIPDDMQGESFRKLAAGEEVDDWRDTIYYHYYDYPSAHMVKRHYGIRTDRYKLIHFYYDIDEWELYDLVTDPDEMLNVYDSTEYSDIRSIMHEKLKKLKISYGDSEELRNKFLIEAGL